MNIYIGHGNKRQLLAQPIVTQDASHEEEMMKSDFVKLSWSDVSYMELPSDAYILFNDVEYSLLEPYVPERKTEAEWKYEPNFHHPKMYLSKVTFKRPSKDTQRNDITYIDWPYTGTVSALMGYLVEEINEVFGFESESEKFGYAFVGFEDRVFTVQFSSVDILSALTTVANTCECEWHLSWKDRMIFFGSVALETPDGTPVLTIGQNVGSPSNRNSKDGYWNAFEPQGSTRNIMRKSSSLEFVQSDVRLSLRKYNVSEDKPDGDYPDGIIYTDGKGNIVTKEQFGTVGERAYVKPLIFEDVYPKQDLYVYNVRYRERYRKDEDGKLVVASTDDDGTQHFLRYATWYMRLAVYNDNDKQFTDYLFSTVAIGANVTKVSSWDDNIEARLDIPFNTAYFLSHTELPDGGVECAVDVLINGKMMQAVIYGNDNDYQSPNAFIIVNTSQAGSDTIVEGSVVDIIGGIVSNAKTLTPNEYAIPSDRIIGNPTIIDGMKPVVAFQPNTYMKKTGTDGNGNDVYEYALTTPLVGLGNGDGSGNYGFIVRSMKIEGKDYIDNANTPPDPDKPEDDGDTGIVDVLTGQPATIDENDYEIEFEEDGTTIIPSVLSQGIVPKGEATPSLRCNIVNLYNVAIGTEFEKAAQGKLVEETLKYIADDLRDKNSYTLNSYPVAFHESNPSLYIGQKVLLDDGRDMDNPDRNDEEHRIATRVQRLVTKVDYSFEQEITVGNEILKGTQTQIKEKVESIINGNIGVGGSNTLSESYIRNIISSWATPRFLSKVANDTAQGKITFVQGLLSLMRAEFGRYARQSQGAVEDRGAAITPDGTGDFMNLVVRALVQGDLNVSGTVTSPDMVFTNILKSQGAIDGESGILMKADEGKIQTDALEVLRWMRIEKLIINNIRMMGQDFIFSEGGDIERVELLDNGNYRLYIHKEKEGRHIEFSEGDILYGNIDELTPQDLASINDADVHDTYVSENGGAYYTSWMLVQNGGVYFSDGMEPDYIDVTLFSDSQVPGKKNFPPKEMMTIAHRGNTTDTERQQLWELSTTKKRIQFLWHVDSPILRDENFALVYGILPNLSFIPSTFNYAQPSVFAGGLVVDHQNIHHVNYRVPESPVIVDCGDWSNTRRYIKGIVTYRDGSKEYVVHQVNHNSATWLCYATGTGTEVVSNSTAEIVYSDGTTEEPVTGSAYWVKTGGGADGAPGKDAVSVQILTDKGNIMRPNNHVRILTAHVYRGEEEVTDTFLTTAFSWVRYGGDQTKDNAWNNRHKNVGNVISIDKNDVDYTSVFECEVNISLTKN